MEEVFSFFLESAFLGLFLFGEKRLSKLAHWGAAFLVFLGSWISGFFIIVTAAWMQNRERDYGRIFLKVVVLAGFISSVAQIFPTVDLHGKYMAKHQLVAVAGIPTSFTLNISSRSIGTHLQPFGRDANSTWAKFAAR